MIYGEFLENIHSIILSGPECTINECEGINCGNGTCIGGTCQCDTNYVNIGNFCERTCALSPCQAADVFSKFLRTSK